MHFRFIIPIDLMMGFWRWKLVCIKSIVNNSPRCDCTSEFAHTAHALWWGRCDLQDVANGERSFRLNRVVSELLSNDSTKEQNSGKQLNIGTPIKFVLDWENQVRRRRSLFAQCSRMNVFKWHKFFNGGRKSVVEEEFELDVCECQESMTTRKLCVIYWYQTDNWVCALPNHMKIAYR